jgi:hypothetical protein
MKIKKIARTHRRLATSLSAFMLFCLLLGISCTKNNDQGPGFDMAYHQEFTIPVGLGTDVVHHFYFHDISTNYSQYLAQHQKTDADIARIIPEQFTLAGIFGDANFDYVDEMTLRIYKESDPNGYIEIAYRYPVPISPGNNLPMIPDLPDIKNFLSGSRFSLDLALRLRNIPQAEIQAKLDSQFKAVLK